VRSSFWDGFSSADFSDWLAPIISPEAVDWYAGFGRRPLASDRGSRFLVCWPIAGGLSILLGYRAKLAAWLIVLFCSGHLDDAQVLAGPGSHDGADPNDSLHENVSMLGAALLILSSDRTVQLRWPPSR